MAKLKTLLKNSFIQVLGINVFLNLVQVISLYGQRNLSDESFGLLNYGIYVLLIFNIITDSFFKFIILKISEIQLAYRNNLLVHIIKKTWIIFIFLGIVMTIFIVILSKVSSTTQFIVIILNLILYYIVYFITFPKVLLISEKKYFFAGISDLFIPIFRMVFTLIFLNNNNIHFLFAGFVISAIVSFLYLKFISKFQIIATKAKLIDIPYKSILKGIVIQLCISVFYIADGIILKSLLNAHDYSVYLTYSLLYKFPFYISLSIVVIILGNNIKEGYRSLIGKFAKSILIILFLFGSVLFFEMVLPGKLLSLLGYSKNILPGITYIFGATWLLNTIIYFVFSFIIKLETNTKSFRRFKFEYLIYLYAITYMIFLYVYNINFEVLIQSLFYLSVASLIIILTILVITYRGSIKKLTSFQ